MKVVQTPQPTPADDSGCRNRARRGEIAEKPTDCRFFYTFSGVFPVERVSMPARNSHGGRALLTRPASLGAWHIPWLRRKTR
jgi:hypothetical protein